MKKRILSAVLVSGVTLGAAASVNAEDYDSQIAAQDSIITELTAEQAETQSQIDSLQSQVSSLESQNAELEAQNAELEAQSQQLSEEIQTLSSKIVARNESLKNQARSAQKTNTVTSYINSILNSKSISDAINRIVAIREVVSANEKMLEQQETDKAELEQKQTENQEAINTVVANQATIAQNQAALATEQAELEVAQLNLASQLATAEEEKSNLEAQKEAAEQAAAQAAAEQAAAEAQAQAEAEAAAASVAVAQEAIASGTAVTEEAAVAETVTATETATTSSASTVTSTTSSYSASVSTSSTSTSVSASSSSSSANTYPVGQCTWGVKSLASWVGNNWGNANQWIASAQAAGYSVGTTPVAGAVAVWPYDGGGYGHVAYVTAVSSSTSIQVMESNYAGNTSIGNYRGSFDPTSSTWGGTVYYIYP